MLFQPSSRLPSCAVASSRYTFQMRAPSSISPPSSTSGGYLRLKSVSSSSAGNLCSFGGCVTEQCQRNRCDADRPAYRPLEPSFFHEWVLLPPHRRLTLQCVNEATRSNMEHVPEVLPRALMLGVTGTESSWKRSCVPRQRAGYGANGTDHGRGWEQGQIPPSATWILDSNRRPGTAERRASCPPCLTSASDGLVIRLFGVRTATAPRPCHVPADPSAAALTYSLNP